MLRGLFALLARPGLSLTCASLTASELMQMMTLDKQDLHEAVARRILEPGQAALLWAYLLGRDAQSGPSRAYAGAGKCAATVPQGRGGRTGAPAVPAFTGVCNIR